MSVNERIVAGAIIGCYAAALAFAFGPLVRDELRARRDRERDLAASLERSRERERRRWEQHGRAITDDLLHATRKGGR